jgi:DNA adenine methylase
MLPILKWSGGKQREITIFKDYYPKSFTQYIEPFVGGGAVYFDLNFKNNVISDTHTDLINFYVQIKKGLGSDIYELMHKYQNNEDTYYFIRDKYVPSNDMERAFVFYYLRKTCFRGMLRYNSKGKFNIPFGRYKSINYDDLMDRQYTLLLKNTDIRNVSFDVIFNEFNDKNNFIFLDPPYDSVFSNYGFSMFGEKKHIELSEMFKKTKNQCLMVIGETDLIKELYEDFIVYSYPKKYSFKILKGRVGNEIDNRHLVISNYI